MNKKRLIRRPQYFYSLLMKITFLITLTVLILSFFLSYNFKNYSIDLLKTSNEKLMNQIYQNALQTNNYVKNYATAMFKNPDATNLMYGQQLPVVEILRSMRNLDASVSSSPFIHSAYFYNGRTHTYYSIGPNMVIREKNFLDQEFVHMISQPDHLQTLTPIPRKIPFVELNPNRVENVFSYILPEYFPGTKKIKNALVLNVRTSWIFNTLQSYEEADSLKGNDILILDPRGNVVANSNADDLFLKNLSSESFVAKILSSGSQSGVLMSEVRDIPSVITYVSYGSSPWILVNITPYRYLDDSISGVKRIAISIGLFMLAFCLIMAFLLAKNLYTPVRNLKYVVEQLEDASARNRRNEFEFIEESFKSAKYKLTSLESFRRSNLFALKQQKLKEFLHSSHANDLNIDALFHEHHIAIAPRSSMAVILFKIDNYALFQSHYSQRDQILLKYALLNMADEIIHPQCRCESLDTGEDEVVTLVNMEADVVRLQGLIREIQHVYAKYCSISVSAFISSSGESIREAREMYEEAVELSRYRLKYGHACIVTHKETNGVLAADFNIDNEKIVLLLEALKKGRKDEAVDLYRSLIQSLSDCSYDTIMFVLSYLSLHIFDAVNLMEKNGTISFGLDFVTFDSKIKSLETLAQIDLEFMKLMETIIFRIQQNRDEKSEIVVMNACRFIESHYMDNSLSAIMIADHFQLTSAYIGKLFREHRSQSIANYISEVRLVKAAALLSETSLNIDEILEKISWENKKHFFTLFKKRFAATPTEYRLKSTVTEI